MKNLWKAAFLVVVLALLASVPLAGCGSTAPAQSSKPSGSTAAPSAAAAKEPYKIGFTNSLSGFMAAMGAPERDVVLALEKKINAEGGINGRPIKVIVYDDQSKETDAVLVVKKLMEQDKVLAMTGTSGSGFAMAQVPIVEEAQVPFVTMNSSRSILNPAKKFIFKLPLSEVFYIENMYKYMKEKNWKKVALFTPTSGFGKEAKKYFEDTSAKQGVTIVGNESYGPDDKDMSPQLTKMKGAGADVLVVYGAEAAGAIAVRQSKDLGYTIPVFGGESLTLPAIMDVKELRDGLEGLYLSGHKPDVWQQLPDTDKQKPINKAINDLIQKEYNRSSGMWEANGHDAFMVLIEAIKRANPDPSNVQQARQKIQQELEKTKDFVGAANIISYSAESHEILVSGTGVINQVQGGKFKLIKAID